jgi:hypothetical protein
MMQTGYFVFGFSFSPVFAMASVKFATEGFDVANKQVELVKQPEVNQSFPQAGLVS